MNQVRDPRSKMPPVDLGACVASLVKSVVGGVASELHPYDLNPVEFNLLNVCMDENECTATELAEVLPVDASRISRIVTQLVNKGLLVRRRLRNDRRVVMLRLSESGNELTSMLRRRIQARENKLVENIPEEDIRVFASVTSRIMANHAATKSSP